MAKPDWVGSIGNGNNQGKGNNQGNGNNQGEEKIIPAVARAGLRPLDEDFKNPEEVSDVPENGPKTGNNNFSDLAAFFKEKIMTMAKPIWAGWAGNGKFNSALDRSWLVTVNDESENESESESEIVFENQGSLVNKTGVFVGTKSNDFLYIDNIIGNGSVYNGTHMLEIDGGGGADHIIMMEDAEIQDAFFTNMSNVTVLKLGDGKGLTKGEVYEATGSSVVLGENAQAAGIREVTGGPGDDVIDFSGYSVGNEGDDELVALDVEDEAIPLEIIIRGGAGADEMTASVGNDTFIWKACDMEGTNEEHADFENDSGAGNLFDVINNFNAAGEDVLDISKLVNGFDCEYYGALNEDTDKSVYLAKWVAFNRETGILSINIDGDGDDFEALVELHGVTELDLVNDLIVC